MNHQQLTSVWNNIHKEHATTLPASLVSTHQREEWQRLREYWEAKLQKPVTQTNPSKSSVRLKASHTGQILKKSHIVSSSVENPPLKGPYKTLQPYSFVPYPKEEKATEILFKAFNTKKVTIKKPVTRGQYKLLDTFFVIDPVPFIARSEQKD